METWKLYSFMGVLFGLVLFQILYRLDFFSSRSGEELFHLFASLGSSVFVLSVIAVFNFTAREIQNNTPLAYIEREFNIFKKRVRADWPTDWTVANTKLVTFFIGQNPVNNDAKVEVLLNGVNLKTTQFWEKDNEGSDILRAVFPAREAGKYTIRFWMSGREVRGSPWTFQVKPGPTHPPSCQLTGPWSPRVSGGGVVCDAGSFSTAYIELKDAFMNTVTCTSDDVDSVQMEVPSPCWTEATAHDSTRIALSVYFPAESSGTFQLKVSYRESDMVTVNFIVLSPENAATVNNSLSEATSFGYQAYYYEACLTKLCGETLAKPKTVYIYLKEKQLIIKEFYLKFIPRKLMSYKVNPRVSLSLVSNSVIVTQNNLSELETLLTFDNSNTPLCMSAAYYTILARRLGGKETFMEKRALFFTTLANHHEKKFHKHVRLMLNINRNHIFESTFKDTRYFLESDWARLFEIRFVGEVGQDQGGVRREWFDLVTNYVFNPENKIFVPTEEGSSVMQPNPYPPSHIKLKHYRLIGKLVGKSLYESSMGPTYRLNINARLAKSFLTQIIGIDVHLTVLASDMPDLWESKIKYILENDVSELDLTFTQEEIVRGSHTVIELVSNGSNKAVTEQNKKQYLSSLARYLLVTRISKQMEAFLEGLHTLVPENLLTLWDEQDLELLLCGVRDFDIEEMKRNSDIIGGEFGRFSLVLRWFWQALAHFSHEDRARFVRFVTGSSVLPPGGWAALTPRIQISWSGAESSGLPSSHTCFNNLVLRNVSGYEEMERSLLTAVREGSEGFHMA